MREKYTAPVIHRKEQANDAADPSFSSDHSKFEDLRKFRQAIVYVVPSSGTATYELEFLATREELQGALHEVSSDKSAAGVSGSQRFVIDIYHSELFVKVVSVSAGTLNIFVSGLDHFKE
jgi:hypothetical protein